MTGVQTCALPILNKKTINVIFNSQVKQINKNSVLLKINENQDLEIDNDLVFIFAGGELPSQFLEKAGIQITKRFNYTLLSHKK